MKGKIWLLYKNQSISFYILYCFDLRFAKEAGEIKCPNITVRFLESWHVINQFRYLNSNHIFNFLMSCLAMDQ